MTTVPGRAVLWAHSRHSGSWCTRTGAMIDAGWWLVSRSSANYSVKYPCVHILLFLFLRWDCSVEGGSCVMKLSISWIVCCFHACISTWNHVDYILIHYKLGVLVILVWWMHPTILQVNTSICHIFVWTTPMNFATLRLRPLLLVCALHTTKLHLLGKYCSLMFANTWGLLVLCTAAHAIFLQPTRLLDVRGQSLQASTAQYTAHALPTLVKVAGDRYIQPGDYVVNEKYGIGKYIFPKNIDISPAQKITMHAPGIVVQYKEGTITWFQKFAENELWLYRTSEAGEQELSSLLDDRKWVKRKKFVEKKSARYSTALLCTTIDEMLHCPTASTVWPPSQLICKIFMFIA